MLWLALTISGLLVGVTAWGWRRRRAFPSAAGPNVAWQRAAARLGLQVRYDRAANTLELTGQRSGMRVCIRREKTGGRSTRVQLTLDHRVSTRNAFGPEDFWVRRRMRASTDELVGDPAFDEVVSITGDPVWIHAVMDAETRAAVAGLVDAHELSLADRDLVWRQTGVVTASQALIDAVEELEALAERLCLTRNKMRDSLARIAATDPLPTVRVAALRTLVTAFPRTDTARRAVWRALDDPAAVVQTLAVESLGDRAVETLERMALGRDKFGQSLATAFPDVQGAALRRALHLVAEDARDGLVRELLWADDPRLWAAAAEAIAEWSLDAGDIADRLVICLAALSPVKRHDDVIEVAVIDALTAVGGAAALELLFERSAGLLTSTPVKDAARRAIAAISARRGPEDGLGGALSLSSDAGRQGALTVADEG